MKTLRFFNHYSIDVSLGTMVSSRFMAEILSVDLSWATTILLGLSVWIIYTFDHLEDARSINSNAVTPRHRVHQKHFHLLSYLMISALILAAVLIFFIPHTTLLWGTVMVCMVGIYFILLKFLNMAFSYYKEVMISIVYSFGIMVGPLSIFHGSLTHLHYAIFAQFVLIAFSNLLVFSLYEEHEDRQQRFPSLVQVLGKRKTHILLQVVFLIQLGLLIWLFFNDAMAAVPLILAGMAFVLFVLSINKTFFKASRTYRLLGDFVFILPVLLLI